MRLHQSFTLHLLKINGVYSLKALKFKLLNYMYIIQGRTLLKELSIFKDLRKVSSKVSL